MKTMQATPEGASLESLEADIEDFLSSGNQEVETCELASAVRNPGLIAFCSDKSARALSVVHIEMEHHVEMRSVDAAVDRINTVIHGVVSNVRGAFSFFTGRRDTRRSIN